MAGRQCHSEEGSEVGVNKGEGVVGAKIGVGDGNGVVAANGSIGAVNDPGAGSEGGAQKEPGLESSRDEGGEMVSQTPEADGDGGVANNGKRRTNGKPGGSPTRMVVPLRGGAEYPGGRAGQEDRLDSSQQVVEEPGSCGDGACEGAWEGDTEGGDARGYGSLRDAAAGGKARVVAARASKRSGVGPGGAEGDLGAAPCLPLQLVTVELSKARAGLGLSDEWSEKIDKKCRERQKQVGSRGQRRLAGGRSESLLGDARGLFPGWNRITAGSSRSDCTRSIVGLRLGSSSSWAVSPALERGRCSCGVSFDLGVILSVSGGE